MLREFAERDGYAVRTKTLPPRRFDVEANVLDSSRLRNDTGWSPEIALKEGIQRMWKVAKKQVGLRVAGNVASEVLEAPVLRLPR